MLIYSVYNLRSNKKRSGYKRKESSSNQAEIVPQDATIGSQTEVDDLNSSVVFISEEKASNEIIKLRELYKTIFEQKSCIRRLKSEVKALQNIVLRANESTSNQNEMAQIIEPTAVDETENENNSFNLTFDQNWIDMQIAECSTSGELSQVCDEFMEFINQQNFDWLI